MTDIYKHVLAPQLLLFSTQRKGGLYEQGELIEAIAKDAGVPKTAAGNALDSTIDAMMRALGKGDRTTLVGFGTFLVSTRQARSGENPKTGEPINIPASNTVKFKPGSAFKQAIK